MISQTQKLGIKYRLVSTNQTLTVKRNRRNYQKLVLVATGTTNTSGPSFVHIVDRNSFLVRQMEHLMFFRFSTRELL